MDPAGKGNYHLRPIYRVKYNSIGFKPNDSDNRMGDRHRPTFETRGIKPSTGRKERSQNATNHGFWRIVQ